MTQMDNYLVFDHNKSFLALTADEDFWDTSGKVVFLGDWCLRYSQKDVWLPLGGKTLEHPWSDRKAFREAYPYVEHLYEKVLEQLAPVMNRIHGIQASERYWRVIIGPWVMLYVGVLYERYIVIKAAIDSYAPFDTIGLDSKAYQLPADTADFIRLIIEDRYNQQLFTKILVFLGMPPARTHDPGALARGHAGTVRVSTVRGLVRSLRYGVLAFNARIAPIVLHNSYFGLKNEGRVAFKTHFKVLPAGGKGFCVPDRPTNMTMRSRLRDISLGMTEFEKMLGAFISDDFPRCFMECFAELRLASAAQYPVNPRVIFSANSWYFDEPFKEWAARSSDQGTLLIGTQHGGNYGCTPYFLFETHELALCDGYYTWGWERPGLRCDVKPASATKLRHGFIGADNGKQGILFVTTSFPRYFYRPPTTIPQMIRYYALQRQFVSGLHPDKLKALMIRLYETDYGWDCSRQWSDQFPGVTLDYSNGVPFLKRLHDCRLYVCDHLATTYVEALAADKPTILFWNQEDNEIISDAQPYFRSLVDAGILYGSPEAAAEAVNRVYDDVEAWWNDPIRQKARTGFCQRFARTSPLAITEWADELMKLAQPESMPDDIR
jgi:putative transferase (TIGR04331 family)